MFFFPGIDNTLTVQQIIDGMYGYNVILTAIATLLFRKTSSRINYILSGAVIMLTLLISHFLTIFFIVNKSSIAHPSICSQYMAISFDTKLSK